MKQNRGLETEAVLARIAARGLLPAAGVYTPEAAVEVARALLAGGLDVMEVTFRQAGAQASVAAIRAAVPEMLVGAGTLLSAEQLASARQAGAQFGVTPGFNPAVVRAALAGGWPIFPGVATPGELEQALALGVRAVKVFPVAALGGPAYLRALEGPYRATGLKVIPMGGVSSDTLADYLAPSMVAAVGGSWMVAETAIAERDWRAIAESTAQAVRLVAAARRG